MLLEDKIKNADRVHKANNLIVQAIQNETNRETMSKMLKVSQMISDIHKDCVADFQHARREETSI